MNTVLWVHRVHPKKQSGGLLALRFILGLMAASLFAALGVVVAGGVAVAGVYLSYVKDLPSAEE
ncbi:MAG: hypothetical protein H5T70_07185, partial [Chloroflexi bacterium]|nr:hypothetical protein [Chloroflexota bacterium]